MPMYKTWIVMGQKANRIVAGVDAKEALVNVAAHKDVRFDSVTEAQTIYLGEITASLDLLFVL